MKRIIKLVNAAFKVAAMVFIAVPMLSSCEKRETPTNGGEGNIITLSATSELPDTKTSLGESNVVNWTAGDKITTFWGDNTPAATFTLLSGEGTTSAKFTGTPTMTTDICYALYPYQPGYITTDKVINLALPSSQKYTAGTFAQGANPMVAYKTVAGSLSFKNLCAVVKLKMTGSATIKRITLSSATKKLSGAASVKMTYGNGAPTIAMASIASNKVVLDCTAEEGGGVTLSETATPFYIVIPATAADVSDNSIKVLIESTTGGVIMEMPDITDNRMNRSKIVNMPSFNYSDVHYLDGGTTGTDRGVGVVINGTIWAPVNCGYHETNYVYGKLYQWGRKDGQGWGSRNDNTFTDESGKVTTIINTPATAGNPFTSPDANTFYMSSSAPYDWYAKQLPDQNHQLWNSAWSETNGDNNPVKTGNDPCPTGWRVPTYTELVALQGGNTHPLLVEIDSKKGAWFNGTNASDGTGIFLPAAGFRTNEGFPIYRTSQESGSYFSSTRNSEKSAWALLFSNDFSDLYGEYHAHGLSVRCVKE